MKAVVLAGGTGTRLRPFTHAGAKQLVPVANKPILFYGLDRLLDAGIHEFGIVVSPQTGVEIQQAVDDYLAGTWPATNGRGVSVHYIRQDTPAGLADALWHAREFVMDDAVCMYLGDNLIGSSCDANRSRNRSPRWVSLVSFVQAFEANPACAASLLLKSVPNPSHFGVAEVDDAGRVVRLEEKPTHPRSDLALVGIYLFRSAIFEAIPKIQPSARGEFEITDAIMQLMREDRLVTFDRLDTWWLDTGKGSDLLHANHVVLDEQAARSIDPQAQVDAASELFGRVRIARGARITNSRIRGPAVIGRDVEIHDSDVYPFCSVGDWGVLRQSRLSNTIVMGPGTTIDQSDIVDSVIGRHCFLHRMQGRVMIGDHSDVRRDGGR